MSTMILALSLAFLQTVPAAQAPADSLLAVAEDTTLSYDQRIAAARAAAEADESGAADAAHARLLMDHPTPDRLVAAEHAIKRAIAHDRENAEYVGLLSQYYWRIGRRSSALDYAERAIEMAPEDPSGHYWSGRYHFWEAMKYLWMSRVEENQDSRGYIREHRIDLGPWGEEAREKAEAAFTRTLELAPEHAESRRYLGLIYYATRRPEALRDLYTPVIKSSPDDPTAHFTIGMSFQLERDYDRAYRAYASALRRLPPADQRFMLAVFTDTRTDTQAPVPDFTDLQRFWTGRDPLFMSPLNERMLEQCRRVAYANLRYGEPEKGIPGWSTDRGQAYIRYGDPLVLQARPPEVDTNIDDPIIAQRFRAYEAATFRTFSDQYQFGKEVWEYEDFALIFENTDTRDAWKFNVAWLDGALIGLDNLVERVPERFVDPFADRRFSVTHQVGQFRGQAGRSRVEIYYAVPVSRVEATTGKGLGRVDLDKGLFLFDAAWDTVDIRKARVDRLAWIRDRGYGKDGYLLSGETLDLAPGTYHVAGEVVDRKNDAVGGFREALEVRRFSSESLDISSILLARRVIEKPERPFGRQRYVVLPNPVGETARERKAYFYFEVYNLARDAFGRTSYNVTYQTKTVPTEDFDSEPEWVTAVTQEVTGDHPWEPVYLALDVQDARPGLRDFRVVVEDKLSGQTTTASTRYRIRW